MKKTLLIFNYLFFLNSYAVAVTGNRNRYGREKDLKEYLQIYI